METKHTLSDVLKRIVVDIDNMNSFLMSLENVLESKSENVSVTQTKDDGSTYTINVPSFGYLKGKIDDINTRFDTLLSTNSDVIGIKSSTGDVRKFELKKTSQLLEELESIQTASVAVPNEFRVKNNWFFESFLNPLLYVSLDIAGILTDDIDRFVVKRIIINSVNNDDAASFFDASYRGRNDVSLATLKADLDANAFDYFEDDNVVDLETAINRYKGTFDVLRILEEEGNQTLTSGDTVSVTRRRYKLSSLNYTDVLSNAKNSRILAEGDVLITNNDSEYVVRSVNKTDTEVVLERMFGLEPIVIGASTLRIKPQPYRIPELQVNVGFNEREVIFIRPVSKAKNLTVDDYSNGVAVFTNELTIALPDETNSTLESYYNNFVADFGLILLNMAKEKKLPSVIGVQPASPALDAANFSVVQIDAHIQDSQNISTLNNTIKEKAEAEKEIQELNKKIDGIKATITTVSKTPQEAKRLQKQLAEVQKEREDKTTTLSTLVTNLTLQISTTPQFVTRKKYSVRGFWQIPTPISTPYGPQNVVQFKYRYRYLGQTGNRPNSQQQTFVDTDGAQKSATFSPWTEVLTKPRSKRLDETTGLYVWTEENVSDIDSVNSNQLDIAIRKGEIVEIQVKSLSEAGWPENPVESDWSNSAQVAFPESISSEEEGTIITQRAFADKTRLDFERSLISRGIDTHVANQFTTGERFFAHLAGDIASGFYTNEGNVIDLFEKLKSIQSTLDAVQQSISLDRGVIQVSVIDSDGNVTNVSNGDTVSLFAGYYKSLIKDTTGGTTIYNEGKVITKQYVVSIANTSATQLELISLLFGGVDELVPTSNPTGFPTDDYHINRRYDVVPIGIGTNPVPLTNKFKQVASLQSGQAKSQFIHSRFKDYGLANDLYYPNQVALNYAESGDYAIGDVDAYDGQVVGSQRIPYNWGHYLPFDPTYPVSGTTQDSRVWNGQLSSALVPQPQGNGYLTEFCISRDHPALTSLGSGYNVSTGQNKFDLFRPKFSESAPPTIDTTAIQAALPFAHALHFETTLQEETNWNGAKYYQQASRVTPQLPTLNTNRADADYPIKLGFTANDEYLIGKYTCGAYLYAFAKSYNSISVEGNFPARSIKPVKNGSENAINIPVLFQFRCSDRLGYIGGYRIGSTLTNVKYQKKIGFDIFVKDDSPFSFDLEVSSQYNKETSIDAPIVQSVGTITSF
jgi:hypothetical protein